MCRQHWFLLACIQLSAHIDRHIADTNRDRFGKRNRQLIAVCNKINRWAPNRCLVVFLTCRSSIELRSPLAMPQCRKSHQCIHPTLQRKPHQRHMFLITFYACCAKSQKEKQSRKHATKKKNEQNLSTFSKHDKPKRQREEKRFEKQRDIVISMHYDLISHSNAE